MPYYSMRTDNTTAGTWGIWTNNEADTWGVWTNGAAASTAANVDTWGYWIDTGTASTSSIHAQNVWVKWSAGSATATGSVVLSAPVQFREPTEEEKQKAAENARAWAEKRQQLEEADRLRREQEAKEKAVADQKAEELLVENLTLNQRRLFRKKRYFYVKAKSGKHYRLKPGWSGNVEEVNKAGKAVNRFCIHPGEIVPNADNVLAQKLLLEADEEAFLRTANRTAIPCPN